MLNDYIGHAIPVSVTLLVQAMYSRVDYIVDSKYTILAANSLKIGTGNIKE